MNSLAREIVARQREANRLDPNPVIPAYAVWNNKRVRVLSYDHDGLFWCLDSRDERRLLHRDELVFVKPKRVAK